MMRRVRKNGKRRRVGRARRFDGRRGTSPWSPVAAGIPGRL